MEKHQKPIAPAVNEPSSAYGSAPQTSPEESHAIPEGYMSKQEFADKLKAAVHESYLRRSHS